MKKIKFQKQIEKLTDLDFEEGFFDSWEIWIKDCEFSLWRHYMQCGYSSEKSAKMEMERIKKQYPKSGKSLYDIKIKHQKVKRLKKPISIS